MGLLRKITSQTMSLIFSSLQSKLPFKAKAFLLNCPDGMQKRELKHHSVCRNMYSS